MNITVKDLVSVTTKGIYIYTDGENPDWDGARASYMVPAADMDVPGYQYKRVRKITGLLGIRTKRIGEEAEADILSREIVSVSARQQGRSLQIVVADAKN